MCLIKQRENVMKTKTFLIFVIFAMIGFGANAEVIMNNHTNANNVGNQWDWQNDVSYQEAQDIATLKNDILLLDQEIEKCKKKKKAWTAATVVGGVGVVATGVGAIVQANKINEKKSDLSDKKEELRGLEQQKNSLN